MKILGVNISHHPTICWYENGEIKKFFNEEDLLILNITMQLSVKYFYLYFNTLRINLI
jgi:hypothetical protein